jgi:outer membrane protein OmpA-like peptidoglycan-associated protein
MLRPEYLFIWILFHLAAVELPSSISKRGQPDLRATELVAKMQYQDATRSYKNIKKVKSAPELRALAVAFTELGQNDTAVALYNRLFNRFPAKANPTDKLNNALILRRMGQYSKADSLVTELKMQSFAGYPILNQPGSLFLEESQTLTVKLPPAKVRTFENSNIHFLPIKNPVSQDWYFHERKAVNTGLMSAIDIADGLPYAKILKAENWGDSFGVKGKILKNQYLNRHFELSYIDSFGNMYVTTNHRLVNDSDVYLLDIFRFYKDPKQGKFTLESLNDQLWQHNLSGFVMNESQTKGLFCSDMMGGLGRSDIYLCDIEWSEDYAPKIINPYGIGEVANTLMSDFDPCFITDDIIAFATEGHVGYGGSDIYFYDLVNNRLVNAGTKINTVANEFGVRYYDGYLYWSSEAYNSNPILNSISLSREVINWFFNGSSVSTELTEPNDFDEAPNLVVKKRRDNALSTLEMISDLEVDKGLKFLLLPDSVRLEIAKNVNDSADYTDFRLRTLLYPQDGLICDEKFETELKIVIELLKQRPNWVVDISSYTDSRGSADFNKTLSKSRADFLRDYFVFYGVKKNQIDVHGYGEEFPINHCVDGVVCSDEEYKRNRRTTMHLKKRANKK